MIRTLLPAAAIAGLAAFALAPTASVSAQAVPPAVQKLIDEAELARIPTEIEVAVDRKDWAKARTFFADQVRVDFTSLVGGQPATIPSDGLMQGWSGNLKGDKQSLHIRGGALVTLSGDKATVYSNGYAWNRKPGAPDGSGDLWEVWGNYTHEMTRTAQGWKVTGFTFVKTHERGSNWGEGDAGIVNVGNGRLTSKVSRPPRSP